MAKWLWLPSALALLWWVVAHNTSPAFAYLMGFYVGICVLDISGRDR